ncbi:MAG: autotransporter-associated beta strand repeat-containing protein [Pirellulales bacterium]|nr:autotransporter-associated beta strand repeat-containing protein [Pirellulales bacterium]
MELKRLIHRGMAIGASIKALKIAFFTSLSWGLLWSQSDPAGAQQRVLGIDVSAWQGNLSQTTWNNLHTVNDRDFVFIRSSRGGTTGYYNQSDPNNLNDQNTLSQRYDDPYFVQNITRATSAGMCAGPYHFARPDIIATTENSGGIANTGTDEANHFIQMAGAWMRPGYLLPVLDLEAGQNERTKNELAQFCIDFSDRIYEVMGIRPAIYTNGNYANDLQGASSSLQDAVVAAFPTLWSARWPNQTDPDSIPIQTGHPKDTYTPIYGPWDDSPNPTHPWSFWQYASTARLSAYNNGNSNIDVDVAQGGIEFLKDHLVPALWTSDSSGQWTTLTNWNSGQTPIAPVQGPGQVPRVGPLTLPAVRLPGSNDTVILDRPSANITVTLASGTHTIRKLEVREALNITGGSLTINYVPSADSTPISAQFSAPVTLHGGSLRVHTLQVDAMQTFSLGGTLTCDTIHLMPHSSTPAKIMMVGDVTFSSLDGAAATIVNGSGTGSSGLIDLGGVDRTWHVSNGAAAVDLAIAVPIVNGALSKSGAGTLAIHGASSYTGDTTVQEGTLRIGNPLLSDTADVYLSAGTTLDLNFTGNPDIVDSLFFDGVSQASGIWGAVGSGAFYTSPFLTGTGRLQVSTYVAPIPGDFNHDGSVDRDDFIQWLGDFGINGQSDADEDGDSDGSDFLVWQRHFGSGGSSSAISQAVPEPSSIVLVGGLAIIGLFKNLRSRRGS